MQKEKIRTNLDIDLKTIASFFDEDIIILCKNMSVAYLNNSAKKNLNIKQYKQNETHCSEVFKNFCLECNACRLESLNSDSKTNISFTFDETYDYVITAQYIPVKLFEKEYILCKGKKVLKSNKPVSNKPSKAWNLKIDVEHKILESDENCFPFISTKKEELLKNEQLFTSFIKKSYIPSFERLHQKVIDSGRFGETLSVIKNNESELRVVLKLTPNDKNNFTNCTIEVIPFLKDKEDEITQFENLRLQDYLYTIADDFARADNHTSGYKQMTAQINEVLTTNLCGIIHFKSKNALFVNAALVNDTYYINAEPDISDADIIPYFTRQLIINDEIKIANVNKSKVIYKDELLKTGIHAFYALPLKHNLRLVGVIILGFPKITHWKNNYIEFIKTIGSIVLNNLMQDEISEKLKRVNDNFLNIFESSSDAVFIVKLDGKIIEVNRAAETLTGYSKKELTGKNVSDISKSENLNLTQIPFEMIQSHQMIFGTEVINLNGESIPVETREKMIRFQDKLSILIIARDVRHRREISKMMVQTISETEDKERQRIAEGLHDDVGPLLSTLRIYIDLLKSEELSEDEIDEYAIKMNEIIHMAIETVREVSRNLMPGVLNDFGLIEALNDFCSKINKTGVIRINFDYDAKHYNLGNSIRNVIYTVIKELINNSIKHADASEILLSLKKKQSNLIITLQDNGIGFEMEKVINQNKSGLGIKNLLSKVNAISGEIELLDNKGFGIKIKVPLQ
ncbi:MAG: hypothetical protein C0599_10820 [Salinivirgaceae bacterium]|nr:MAG: hypothetical protein C0599_10820 [Salinivirgaceae bacterium]